MRVFAVFKDGVYRHECGGVFSTFKLARDAALKLISGERDDYHGYEVLKFELDEISKQSPVEERCNSGDGFICTVGGDVSEPDAILTLRRNGADISVTPNAKSEPTSAALSREVGSTDGLCSSAPTKGYK